MTTKQDKVIECYACGNECKESKGIWRDAHDECIGAYFICEDCANEEDRIYGRFEEGESDETS